MAVEVKTLSGLAYANVKSRNGLAVASISTINGLDVTAGGGTPSLIASTQQGGSPNTVTTSAIDTTGANFIVVNAGYYPGSVPALSDSKSNTWAPLTAQINAGIVNRLFYCFNPTVGSGHTFTLAGSTTFPSIQVDAFDNMGSGSFDVENGTTFTNQITVQPGSVTPSQANTLVIAGIGFETNSGGAVSVDGGFTANTSPQVPGSNEGGSIAYLVLSSIAAQNPTWNLTNNSGFVGATIAAFAY